MRSELLKTNKTFEKTPGARRRYLLLDAADIDDDNDDDADEANSDANDDDDDDDGLAETIFGPLAAFVGQFLPTGF